MMNVMLIVCILITMVFSAFFSGMEIAFVSSNRMLAEMDKEKNGLPQKCLDVFFKHPSDFVSTMLVGNNIALVIYGILIAKLFDATIFRGYSAGFTVPADTILSTVIVLFTGEFLPKTFFKSIPNRLLTFFAIPAYFCYIILWPLSKFSSLLAKTIMRLFGVKVNKETGDEVFSKEEVKIFQNALDFSETRVRDCMIPRTEIEAVPEECGIDELNQKFIESGHSKIIVYRDDIDHIIGYVHSSEMFRKPDDWRKDLRTMPFVPETMSAQKMMQIFLQQKKSLGVVVDEFGGTSGIVSLEDIVEEIFGEIEDEHDSSNYIAKNVGENEYLLSARLEIDKVNEMFSLQLPESDDYMTIGGLILHYYQSFPKLNEVVKIGPFQFKIIKNTMTKIELVKLFVTQ